MIKSYHNFIEELSKTFYDNYDWLTTNSGQSFAAQSPAAISDFLTAYSSSPYPLPFTQGKVITGLVTGTKMKVLNSGTTKYLYSISYYDEKGRVIDTRTQNVLCGTNFETTQYSFSGQDNGTGGKSTVMSTRRNLDHQGRITSLEKKVKYQDCSSCTAVTSDWKAIANSGAGS